MPARTRVRPFPLASLQPYLDAREFSDADIGLLLTPHLSIPAARRNVQRIRHNFGGMLTVDQADTLCCALNIHPGEVWGNAWFDEPIVAWKLKKDASKAPKTVTPPS